MEGQAERKAARVSNSKKQNGTDVVPMSPSESKEVRAEVDAWGLT